MTVKRYFDAPLVFEFRATVIDAVRQDDDTVHIVLDETYFYPAGGGQSHDTGTLNGQSVIAVHKDGDTVIHVVEGEPLTGQVAATIHADNRLRNMAAHTGQHIVSAIALAEFDAQTLAVRMNAYGISTVDIALAGMDDTQLAHLEKCVNDEIRANHPVRSRFVAPDSPELDQLRRAVKFDKVTGDVRLVEIEGVDLSACAGTHFPFTGMIGMLKIFKAENYKGGTRLHFAAGDAARDQFTLYQHTLDNIANNLSAGIEDVPQLIEKLQSERSDLAKQVVAQQEQLLSYEAQSILKTADSVRITLTFDNRDSSELRTLANLLIEPAGNAVVMTNRHDDDVMVIVAASEVSDIHAGNTLKAILSEFEGRGGGRDSFARGVLKNFTDMDSLLQVIQQQFA